MKKIRLATRRSPLALWQSEHIKNVLMKNEPGLAVELVPLVTQGDKILDTSLSKIGGKGLFVKELELALLNNDADIAVHSMKDVPAGFPEGLTLEIVGARENPHDALVSNQYSSVNDLPSGAVVGSSSLRRQTQLLALRPDVRVEVLRGNVQTRLGKLDSGEFDAILLACAGLIRLEMQDRIKQEMSPIDMLPGAGQGVLGIEYRSDESDIGERIRALIHSDVSACVKAERAVNRRLGASCQVPVAAFAVMAGPGQIWLRARIVSPGTNKILHAEGKAPIAEGEMLGEKLANQLLAQGGDVILTDLGISLP